MPSVTTSERQVQQTLQARQAARRELVQSVQEGMTAREAHRRCPVQMHRTTVYRLLKCVKREGEQALTERRHGHPTKLRGDIPHLGPGLLPEPSICLKRRGPTVAFRTLFGKRNML